MAALVIAGRLGNALTGASFTSSPAADALFPFSKLSDGVPGARGKFGSLTAAPSITADIDMLRGEGTFEAGDLAADGWTAVLGGSGVADVDTSPVHSGTYSLVLDAGSGLASCYNDVTVRAGQRLRIDIWLRADGASGEIDLRCRNLNTGNWLNPAGIGGGDWLPVDGPIFTHTITDIWTNYTFDFQVESTAACGGPLTTLRFQILNDVASSVAWADDFVLIPGVSFSSVHGHNIDPRSAPQLRASTDNFGTSDVLIASPTLRQPTFYSAFGVAYYRYWRQLFADTNTGGGAIWEGEWVLGDALTLESGPLYPVRAGYRDAQLRVPMRWGSAPIGVGPAYPLRTIPLNLRGHSVAERDVILAEIFHRSHGGVPVVVVPHDDDGHTEVIYGLLSEELPHEWWMADGVDLQTSIAELPLPYVTP
jgi:hypothetical protein